MTITINGTTGVAGVDGTAATPALQGNDTDTGVYFGTNEVYISTGGTLRATVGNSGLTLTTSALFPAGTVGAPGISVSGDTDTGIYFPAANTIGFATNGAASMTLDASGNLLVANTDGTKLGANTKIVGGSSSSYSRASLGSKLGGGTGAVDTGISINQGETGGTILLLVSRNTSDGTNTSSAVYIVRFYYDGNNAPTTSYVGGSSDFLTFGVSGSNTLTVTNSGGGNCSYAWFGNK